MKPKTNCSWLCEHQITSKDTKKHKRNTGCLGNIMFGKHRFANIEHVGKYMFHFVGNSSFCYNVFFAFRKTFFANINMKLWNFVILKHWNLEVNHSSIGIGSYQRFPNPTTASTTPWGFLWSPSRAPTIFRWIFRFTHGLLHFGFYCIPLGRVWASNVHNGKIGDSVQKHWLMCNAWVVWENGYLMLETY